MIDLFLGLAEAMGPAPLPPVPSTPPAISRPVEPQIPAATPTKYRLADLDGQAFEHEDPGFLRTWIDQRNAAIMAARLPRTPPPVLIYQRPAARVCGPTGCR